MSPVAEADDLQLRAGWSLQEHVDTTSADLPAAALLAPSFSNLSSHISFQLSSFQTHTNRSLLCSQSHVLVSVYFYALSLLSLC